MTAASKGLGYAVAEALLTEGCRVAICSSSQQRIEAAAERLSPHGEVIAMAADLAQPDECADLVDWALHTLGGLDVLVNNAGGPPPGTFESLDEAQWRHAFDSLLMSAVRITRAALPALKEDPGGAVVNLTSLTAKQPIDMLLLSNAFRPAILGMAKTLSREAAPEVRVNNIATEHILTDRIRQLAGVRAEAKGTTLDAELESSGRRCLWAGSGPRRSWPTPPSSSPATPPATSPASPWRWTAASTGGSSRPSRSGRCRGRPA